VGLNNILWFRNGTLISGQTGISLTVNTAGSYTVRATGPTGCPGNSAPVIVNINNPIVFSFAENPSICKGEEAVLDASPSGAIAYSWSTGANTPVISVSEAGVYTVEISDGLCSSSSTVTVSFKADPPTVSLGNDTIICSDAGFTLIPQGANIISYLWSDGSTASSFAVKEPGTISLQVEGECGTAEASVNIGFKECGCKVFIPNAFTPNKDGNNDILKPLYKCQVEDIWFVVFNRWGEKVFETRELGKGWDGFYKNELQPNDAYLYYIRYFDPGTSQSFEEKGTVLLLK
jgi:gliding motility-associated-like protein